MESEKKDNFSNNGLSSVSQDKRVEAQMEMILSQYKDKKKEKKSLPVSKMIVFGIAFILMGGMVLAVFWMNKNIGLLSELSVEEKKKEESTGSSGRKVDWSELEAEVQKKRLESDIEFEVKKENGQDENEIFDTGEETDSNSSVEANAESNSLKSLEEVIGILDQEEIESPEDYDF